MSAPASRRGFLRGLTTLPLIGGGVALIGAPSAVAEPVTVNLLTNYETWLQQELLATARAARGDARGSIATCYTPAWEWHMRMLDRNEGPATRAALVMASVGCDWREGGR
ncbi:hypothetical protein MKK50_16285 [Methylobacterium sp. J-043]|nr:hypothetical protein [Methylobacterium sp. J-043]